MHKIPVKISFISFSSSDASFSSTIAVSNLLVSVITLPYPKGSSKCVVRIENPFSYLSISSCRDFSDTRGTSPYKTKIVSSLVVLCRALFTASAVPS